MRQGNGYLGSSEVETSTSNQEIIPDSPSHWTMAYELYKFAFMNYSDCQVLINNAYTIFLKEGQGFCTEMEDAPIHSFKILSDGINFNWVGAY